MNQYIISSKNIALLFKVSKALTAAEKQWRYHQRYQRHSQLQKNNDTIIKGTHSCRKIMTLLSKALAAAEKQQRYHQRYQRHSQLQKNNDAIINGIKGTHSCRKAAMISSKVSKALGCRKTTMLSSKALTAAEKQRRYHQRYQRHWQLQKNNDAIIKCIKGTHSCRKTTMLSSKVSKALTAAEKQRRYHQRHS